MEDVRLQIEKPRRLSIAGFPLICNLQFSSAIYSACTAQPSFPRGPFATAVMPDTPQASLMGKIAASPQDSLKHRIWHLGKL